MGVGGAGGWRWVGLGFAVDFSLFHSGFQWILVFCSGFQWAVAVGWVSDGGGGLGFLMMAVFGGGCKWWLGCFCLGEEIHRERERKRCRE